MDQEFLEAGLLRDDAVAACEKDLNFFAAAALPDVFKYLFPSIFLAVWNILQVAIKRTRGKDYLALGIPRGFGKTILMKLYVVFLVLFTDRKFILVVCNTDPLAQNFITDVADILDSDNIKNLFGDWRAYQTKDTLNIKKFVFRGRHITIAGIGAQSSMRGLNIKFVRPDVILMDDMQSREEAESPTEAAKSMTWMLGTLMKAASPDRCLYIFVGNMYPFEGSILKKLKYNPTWISFITGAILADGESIWPELKPVEELLTELENDTSLGHPEIFYSEVMNDEEAGTRSGLDISKIAVLTDQDLPAYHHSGAVIIDPSLGERKSDNIVMGAMLIYDTSPVLREALIGKWNPLEVCREAIKLCLKYELPAIVVESEAYQKSLIFWMNHIFNQMGIKGVVVLPVDSGKKAKNARIVMSFKELVSGQAHLHTSVRNDYVYQAIHFNPMKPNNVDDLLDVFAYMTKVCRLYPNQIQRPLLTVADPQTEGLTDEEALNLPW